MAGRAGSTTPKAKAGARATRANARKRQASFDAEDELITELSGAQSAGPGSSKKRRTSRARSDAGAESPSAADDASTTTPRRSSRTSPSPNRLPTSARRSGRRSRQQEGEPSTQEQEFEQIQKQAALEAIEEDAEEQDEEPTGGDDVFDQSIAESEGFTLVSLEDLRQQQAPSSTAAHDQQGNDRNENGELEDDSEGHDSSGSDQQRVASSMSGIEKQTPHVAPAPGAPPSVHSSPVRRDIPRNSPAAQEAGAALQNAIQDDNEITAEGASLFSAFGSGTSRELKRGLAMGEALANRSQDSAINGRHLAPPVNRFANVGPGSSTVGHGTPNAPLTKNVSPSRIPNLGMNGVASNPPKSSSNQNPGPLRERSSTVEQREENEAASSPEADEEDADEGTSELAPRPASLSASLMAPHGAPQPAAQETPEQPLARSGLAPIRSPMITAPWISYVTKKMLNKRGIDPTEHHKYWNAVVVDQAHPYGVYVPERLEAPPPTPPPKSRTSDTRKAPDSSPSNFDDVAEQVPTIFSRYARPKISPARSAAQTRGILSSPARRGMSPAKAVHWPAQVAASSHSPPMQPPSSSEDWTNELDSSPPGSSPPHLTATSAMQTASPSERRGTKRQAEEMEEAEESEPDRPKRIKTGPFDWTPNHQIMLRNTFEQALVALDLVSNTDSSLQPAEARRHSPGVHAAYFDELATLPGSLRAHIGRTRTFERHCGFHPTRRSLLRVLSDMLAQVLPSGAAPRRRDECVHNCSAACPGRSGRYHYYTHTTSEHDVRVAWAFAHAVRELGVPRIAYLADLPSLDAMYNEGVYIGPVGGQRSWYAGRRGETPWMSGPVRWSVDGSIVRDLEDWIEGRRGVVEGGFGFLLGEIAELWAPIRLVGET